MSTPILKRYTEVKVLMEECELGEWLSLWDILPLSRENEARRIAGNRLAALLAAAPRCVCETPTRHCRGCQADEAARQALIEWKRITK